MIDRKWEKVVDQWKITVSLDNKSLVGWADSLEDGEDVERELIFEIKKCSIREG